MHPKRNTKSRKLSSSKSRRLPTRSHHSSQASADVPLTIKKQVKFSQGNYDAGCVTKQPTRKTGRYRLLTYYRKHLGNAPSSNTHLNEYSSPIYTTGSIWVRSAQYATLPSIQRNGRFFRKASTWLRDAKTDPQKDYIQHGIVGEKLNFINGDCCMILAQWLPRMTISELLSRIIQLKVGRVR